MPFLPFTAQFKHYAGAKPELRRKNNEAFAVATRIAEHVNRLVANNPNELQQYYFASIAAEMDVTTNQVRSAISDGGYNGITLRVTGEDREELKRYES